MAVSQPITNVGGISGEFSLNTEIRNAASGVWLKGYDTAQIGYALVSPYRLNADLPFSLPLNSNQYRLDFGNKNTLPITHVGGINSAAFGVCGIQNTAYAVSSNGVASGVMGLPTLTPYLINADLIFNLTNNDDINKTRLDFGNKTALVITEVGNINGALGGAEIYQNDTFRPNGMNTGGVGHTIITHSTNNGWCVDLLFRQPEYTDYNKNRLDFGNTSQLVISNVGGINNLAFGGETFINNTATSINAHGILGGLFGNAMLFAQSNLPFDDAINAASVNLYFTRRDFNLSALNVPLAFNTEKRLKPYGFDNSELSANATIYNKTQFVFADSTLLHDEIGYHKLREPYAPSVLILPSIGDTATIVRSHQVISWRQQITVGGWDSFQQTIHDAIEQHDFNEPCISNRNQFVAVVGADCAAFPLAHNVSNFERSLDLLGNGVHHPQFGQAWIDYSKRYINLNDNTDGIAPPVWYGNAHSIGTSQTISVKGWENTEWLTRIVPERQSLGVIGFDNQEIVFEHTVFNQTQKITLKDDDTLNTLHGTALVYNTRQYIHHDLGIAPIDETDPRYTQQWHKITNVNRAVGVFGINSEKHSKQHTIKNNAKRIDAHGFTGEIGLSLVSHNRRYIHAASIQPLIMSRWHTVYNAAMGVYPTGFDSLATGQTHWVENTRRYYRWITLKEQTLWGTPFIDFAVRTVQPNTIKPEYLGFANTFNSNQYVEPVAFTSKWGETTIRETRNIIQIESIEHGKNAVAYPKRVYNFNPEIHRAGRFDSSDFGFALIDNLKKYIHPQGADCGIVAKPIYVGDNTQRLYLSGLWTEEQSTHHKFIQGMSPPYATQQIILKEIRDGNDNVFAPNYGIAPPNQQVGAPRLTDNTIRSKQSSAFTQFGQTNVFHNAICVLSGIYSPFDFGETLIKHTQMIGLEKYGIEPDEDNQVSKPKLSPHTIYAPSSDMADEQARRNHPTQKDPNVIGYPDNKVSDDYKLGKPTIQHKNRAIYHLNNPYDGYGNDMARIGDCFIANSIQVVYLNGIKPDRFGLPLVPNTQEVELPKRNTREYTEWGTPEIKLPEEMIKYVKPDGLIEEWGDNEIQKLNREIYPQGFNNLQMGASDKNDKLYLPQSLWIGFPITTFIDGSELTEWGNARISNWIQEIKPDGNDMLQMRYDRTKFQDRMKVKRISPNPPPK